MNTRENWRKLLSLFLVLTMCLATLPLSAFAEEDCAHEWGEWETSKVPTCSEEGEQTRTCSVCGDTETEALEKLAHTPKDVEEVPAQVGVPGKTVGTVCSVCGEVLTGCEAIEALEEEEDETGDELVRVVFICTPEETEVTVYESVRNEEDELVPVLDENEEPVVIEPEEDGSWLLLPGTYLYDAVYEGYTPIEMEVFKAKENDGEQLSFILKVELKVIEETEVIDESRREEREAIVKSVLSTEMRDVTRSNTVSGEEFVSFARENCLGKPYVSYGRTTAGFDCCGLVWYACNHFGIDVGDGNQTSQINYGTAVYYSKSSFNDYLSNLQLGDLIFFDYESDGQSDHVGIYSGNGNIIQAQSPGYLSHEFPLSGTWLNGIAEWQFTCGIRRVIGTVTYAPVSCLDVAEGGDGTIHVRGWSFDRDDLSGAVPIHIYVGSNGDTNHGYAIEANSERVDVNNVYNVGDYHGFDAVITVNERGTQTLYFWACDIGGGPGNQQFATATVTINNPASSNSGNSIQLEVPLLPQANGYTCADASARECIAYYMQHGYTTGKSTTVPSEAQLVTEYGSGSITPIVNGLSDYCGVSFGYKEKTSYETFYSDVYNSISKGNPVVAEVYLADSSSWVLGYTTDGHYIVISGIQKDGNETYLTIQDPWNSNGAGIGQTITVNAVHICNICVYYLVEQNGLTVAIPETGSLMSSGAGQTIPDGDYIIASAANTNYYLDIDGFDCPAAECTNVHLWGPTTPAEVQACDVWTVEYIDDGGFYTICQKQSNAALDVDRASLVEGGNVDVYPKNGSVAQEWSIYPLDGNTYRIQAKCSGYALDIVDANISSGTNVRQWSVNDSNAQKWVFIPYSLNTFTVTFDANGGSEAPESQSETVGNAVVLSCDIPNRSCHAFLGWAESSDASVPQYQPGENLLSDQDITLFAVWTENALSEWSATQPEGVDESLVQSMTQYRYRDKETTTGTESTMDGWTLSGSEQVWNDYGSWSEWQDSGITGSDSVEVETRTVYPYYYFYCTNCGTSSRYPYWGENLACEVCGSTGTRPLAANSTEWFPNPWSNSIPWGDNTGKYYQYIDGQYIDGGIWWNWEDGSPKTQYRSRTRTESTMYSFYRWGEWSAWSPVEIEASDTRETEERVLYRYIDVSSSSHSPGTPSHANEIAATCTAEGSYEEVVTCTVCGKELSREQKTTQKLPHVTELQNAKEATAAENGYTGDEVCTVCGEVVHAGAVTYYISYNANGGINAPEAQSKIHDVALTLSDAEPTHISSGTSFTVTLNANGSGASVNPASLSAASTTSYSFAGWNTQQQGGGTSYAPGASYTANEALTLYAQWNTDTETASVTLPMPTRDGYSFKGWGASADATSGVTGSYTPSDNVTLYAVWEEINSNAIRLDVSSETLKKGSTCTVSVTLSENSNAEIIQFALLYDYNTLHFVSAAAGEALSGNAPTFNGAEAGVFYLNWDSTTPLTAGGSLVNITFEATETAALGESQLTISDGSALDSPEFILMECDQQGNLSDIPVIIGNGTITVIDYTLGDVDNNGKINAIDANLVRRHAAKLITLEGTRKLAADVNHDGKINAIDANLIRRYAAKLISEFPA